ncbi:MAG TPA: beta/gamma crystallin-related protein [Casimicrobiaceae bacterium]
MRAKFLLPSSASIAFALSSSALAGSITLLEQQNYQGRSLPLRGDQMPDLDRTEFNDRTQSIGVDDGYWEICTDSYFRGSCMTLGLGQYLNLTAARSRPAVPSTKLRCAPTS